MRGPTAVSALRTPRRTDERHVLLTSLACGGRASVGWRPCSFGTATFSPRLPACCSCRLTSAPAAATARNGPDEVVLQAADPAQQPAAAVSPSGAARITAASPEGDRAAAWFDAPGCRTHPHQVRRAALAEAARCRLADSSSALGHQLDLDCGRSPGRVLTRAHLDLDRRAASADP